MSENQPFEPIFTSREKNELRGAHFSRHRFVGVDLADADLRGALFEDVVFERCNLTGADLRDAHFIRCELVEVVMADIALRDCRFDGTSLRGVIGLSDERRLAIVRQGGLVQPLRASLR